MQNLYHLFSNRRKGQSLMNVCKEEKRTIWYVHYYVNVRHAPQRLVGDDREKGLKNPVERNMPFSIRITLSANRSGSLSLPMAHSRFSAGQLNKVFRRSLHSCVVKHFIGGKSGWLSLTQSPAARGRKTAFTSFNLIKHPLQGSSLWLYAVVYLTLSNLSLTEPETRNELLFVSVYIKV